LPEFIGEGGDVPLSGFVGNSVGALPGPRPLALCLCDQVCLIGVLTALPGAFISGQVIFFAVMFGAGTMGMRGNVTAFGRYLL
jgi:hypothetical protein